MMVYLWKLFFVMLASTQSFKINEIMDEESIEKRFLTENDRLVTKKNL